MAQHWPKYYLNSLIQDAFRNPPMMGELLQQPDGLFARYGLNEQEQAAMRKPDPATLVGLGVHPLLAMAYMVPFDAAVREKLSIDAHFAQVMENL